MIYNKLISQEERVIVHKGTELPFSGEYVHTKEDGLFACRRCTNPLFLSDTKFDSHCGWPSFDDSIAGAVLEISDEDGFRTEIVCAQCKAHLGHVFIGEHFTAKNTRHCVNSISIKLKK